MKKIIPPIIVTVILIIYLLIYISGALHIPGPSWLRISGVLIPIVFIYYAIHVLIERIKEIRSGEEDDLSKY